MPPEATQKGAPSIEALQPKDEVTEKLQETIELVPTPPPPFVPAAWATSKRPKYQF